MPPGDRALLPRAALLREASAHAPCPPSSATGTEAACAHTPGRSAGIRADMLSLA